MNRTELIEELTDICIRQAEIIKAQAQMQEEQALAEKNRLEQLVGDVKI